MLQKHVLSNGVPVFLVESHSSPVVSIQAWVCRGSAHEPDKLAGISHFLEHSLFKGTRKRKVGQIADEIESRGGEINAYTSFEETVYYATLASRFFDQGLDVIADAVQNPAFDADEMLREREVILEEIRRAQDSPFKMVATRLWNSLYAGTPYGRPVLGFEDTVKKIDAKKLKTYFQNQYNAGTLSVVVVGDVNAKTAFAKIEKKFSRLKKKPRAYKIVPIKARAQSKPKTLTLSKDIQECQLQIGWPAPKVTDANLAALDLAVSAIGQGESSRLYQRLVKDKKLALSAHLGLAATPSCGMLALTLVTAPEHLEPAIAEALKVIDEAVNTGLTLGEIERVKTSLESDVVGAKETVEGYARRLGSYYHQFGDPQYESRYLEQILAVESEAAIAELAKVLKVAPTLSMAHPKNMQVNEAALLHVLKAQPIRVAKTESAQPVTEAIQFGKTRILIKTANSIPVIGMRWIFAGGSREEKPSQYGLANLFQRTWTSGTKNQTSLQIAHTLESLGASCYAFSGRHTLGFSFECLRKQWPLLKPLVHDILTAPTFPEEEVQTEKELICREILSEKDSPGSVCQLNFMASLYGDHPYGRSSLGNQQSVTSLTSKDLHQFYRRFVHQGKLVVSMVGALDHGFWESEVQPLVKALAPTGDGPAPANTWKSPERLRVTTAAKQPLFQSHLLIGFAATTLFEPERYALKLLSSCLSGQGGRLFMELRDRQSLAYTVAPMASDSPERGMFGVYIGCAPDKLPKAVSGIRGELVKVIEKPITARELERSKQYWLGRYELDMQRYLSQAMTFGLDEYYGLGFDHYKRIAHIINAISAEEVRRAAAKYITLDRATISVVHPEPLQEASVAEMWQPKTVRTPRRPEATL
jgi:zinc protease